MQFTDFMIAEEGLLSKLREKKEAKAADKAAAKEFLQHPNKVLAVYLKAADQHGVEVATGTDAKQAIQRMCDTYNDNPGHLKKHKNHSEVKVVSSIPVVIVRYDHDDSICQIVVPIRTKRGKVDCDFITAGTCAKLMTM